MQRCAPLLQRSERVDCQEMYFVGCPLCKTQTIKLCLALPLRRKLTSHACQASCRGVRPTCKEPVQAIADVATVCEMLSEAEVLAST